MKQQDSSQIIERLEKAGAGISTTKKLAATYMMFPLLNYFISWEKAWDIYDKEGEKIVRMASSLSQEQLFERVLVPRLFGLEDNSRYYSVAMVIEHLLIVGKALQVRIPILSQGKELKGHVKIEDVKPYTEIDVNIVETFQTFLSSYREKLQAHLGDIHINNTSAHPWFGEFNPKQWSILGMVHQIVHRRQIEAIIKSL
jgi:hypothetical protein